jgi:hypothetical protein
MKLRNLREYLIQEYLLSCFRIQMSFIDAWHNFFLAILSNPYPCNKYTKIITYRITFCQVICQSLNNTYCLQLVIADDSFTEIFKSWNIFTCISISASNSYSKFKASTLNEQQKSTFYFLSPLWQLFRIHLYILPFISF